MLIFKITANHKGFFEFRLCNVDSLETDASQACLNQTQLTVLDTNHESDSKRYRIHEEMHMVELKLALPGDHFACRHCVLQWKYVAGNSWGFDAETNTSCVGCGPVQEQFYGCSDISIGHVPTTTQRASWVFKLLFRNILFSAFWGQNT